MRVRPKVGINREEVIYEVIESSDHYYIGVQLGFEGVRHALEKAHFEPVPGSVWKEITDECEATENWPSAHYSKSNGIARSNLMLWIPSEHCKGFRLRKVPFGNSEMFIVEKKVE